MKDLLILFLIVSFVCSCNSNKESINMVGTWETTYINIDMPTHNGSDTSSTFKADFTDTFYVKNYPRARSVYKDDGTFQAYYILPDGHETGHSDGTWTMTGDTLSVKYMNQGRMVETSYGLTSTSEGWQAKNIYDWDNDKEFDDVLFMKTKRIQ